MAIESKFKTFWDSRANIRTLPETKIAPKNGGFQEESPFPGVYLQVLSYFQGWHVKQTPPFPGLPVIPNMRIGIPKPQTPAEFQGFGRVSKYLLTRCLDHFGRL